MIKTVAMSRDEVIDAILGKLETEGRLPKQRWNTAIDVQLDHGTIRIALITYDDAPPKPPPKSTDFIFPFL